VSLTSLELGVLRYIVGDGAACNGSRNPDELIADNITCCSVNDVSKALAMKLQAVGAVFASLGEKGMIACHGESARGAKNPDWFATDLGIRTGWIV
jgi:hypothetical protein